MVRSSRCSVTLKNVSRFFVGCECNLSGTVSGSSACTDNDGDCLCDVAQGYTGTKCEECLGGWWWMSSDRTCMGNRVDKKIKVQNFPTAHPRFCQGSIQKVKYQI